MTNLRLAHATKYPCVLRLPPWGCQKAAEEKNGSTVCCPLGKGPQGATRHLGNACRNQQRKSDRSIVTVTTAPVAAGPSWAPEMLSITHFSQVTKGPGEWTVSASILQDKDLKLIEAKSLA